MTGANSHCPTCNRTVSYPANTVVKMGWRICDACYISGKVPAVRFSETCPRCYSFGDAA